MDNSLPLRLMVLKYISTIDRTSIEQAMDFLRPYYGKERQFTKANFLDHFLALKENGLIDDVDYQIDQQGELRMYFAINHEGQEVLRRYG